MVGREKHKWCRDVWIWREVVCFKMNLVHYEWQTRGSVDEFRVELIYDLYALLNNLICQWHASNIIIWIRELIRQIPGTNTVNYWAVSYWIYIFRWPNLLVRPYLHPCVYLLDPRCQNIYVRVLHIVKVPMAAPLTLWSWPQFILSLNIVHMTVLHKTLIIFRGTNNEQKNMVYSQNIF